MTEFKRIEDAERHLSKLLREVAAYRTLLRNDKYIKDRPDLHSFIKEKHKQAKERHRRFRNVLINLLSPIPEELLIDIDTHLN